MGASNITEQRTYGAIVLDRFGGVAVPAGLKAEVASFANVHGKYEGAAALADAARGKRDQALEAVGEADDVFDGGVSTLADKVVGAGLGSRKNPFAGLSKYAPSRLTELPYAEEPKVMRSLGAALAAKKPPAEVTKALAKCLKDADGLEAALAGLTKPQAAYAKALSARDALLPGWAKALRRLKKHAAAAWDEEEGTYKAVFAPVGAVQAPKKGRAKKVKTAAKVEEAGKPGG